MCCDVNGWTATEDAAHDTLLDLDSFVDESPSVVKHIACHIQLDVRVSNEVSLRGTCVSQLFIYSTHSMLNQLNEVVDRKIRNYAGF